jgi:toxoflavin biosynthesis protein ToxD
VHAPVADRQRIVEVIADLGEVEDPRWRYGSGLLIGQRQVLTSAHVVNRAKRVRVRGTDKRPLSADMKKALVGKPQQPGLDLALLPVPRAPLLPDVPIALVNRNCSIGAFIDRCAAVGYPLFQELERGTDGDAIRETAQIFGRIAPLEGLAEGRLVSFYVLSSPEHEVASAGVHLDTTEWSGMSGAAVLAPDGEGRPARLLIGVVAEHAPRRGSSSISVLPLNQLFDADACPPDARDWWTRLGISDPSSLPLLPRPHRQHESEPELIEIPAGPFMMGAEGGDAFEAPPARVVVGPFSISRYPITNAEFAQFVNQTHASVAREMGWAIADVGQQPPPERRDHPVVGVSWDAAREYCQWLSKLSGRNYRLPTEAEWEKAARGPGGSRYPWGDAFDSSRCNTAEGGRRATTAVGTYSPAGDSGYGCADMAGNVLEWTSTSWGSKYAAPHYRPPYRADDGRESPEKGTPFRELRVCRGGSFTEPAARATCYARSRVTADVADPTIGFRVVADESAPD